MLVLRCCGCAVLYVSFGSKVRPRTFGCVAMGARFTAGVHDQQLPERCRHLPEGKLVFDLCAEVNSHALHPGQTPVPDASRYYS